MHVSSLCGAQSEHGGHTNAYTAAESTNYHFDCNWDSLNEALDRFAQVKRIILVMHSLTCRYVEKI